MTATLEISFTDRSWPSVYDLAAEEAKQVVKAVTQLSSDPLSDSLRLKPTQADPTGRKWRGGMRQNFSGGNYMYWRSDMGRAVAAIGGPTRFAMDRLDETTTGSTSNGRWSGWCLRFAYLAHGRSWALLA